MSARHVSATNATCIERLVDGPHAGIALDRICGLADGRWPGLTQPGGLVFVCVDPKSNAPIAFIEALRGGDDIDVLMLATHRDHRRRGHARALLTELERVVRADVAGSCIGEADHHAAPRLVLEVRADNAAAIALYRNAGFVDVGLRPRYYRTSDGTACDALLLAKRLVPGDMPRIDAPNAALTKRQQA
ncbi:MAG: N-acetyltransferase [Pseudomonadota bacterium]